MVQIISLGTCSYYIVYPVVNFIVLFTINKTEVLIGSQIQEEFFFTTAIGLMFMAEILAGCLYFIYRCRKQNSLKRTLYAAIPKSTTLYQGKRLKYTLGIIFFIISLGALDLASTSVAYLRANYYAATTVVLKHTMMSLQFFLYIFLSIIILHQAIFIHHYVAIGLSLFGVVLIMIPLFSEEIQWMNILLIFIKYVLNALLYVSDKWLMHFKEIHPFTLLLIQGIFGFVVFLIMLIPIFTLCPKDSTEWYCNDINFLSKMNGLGGWYILVEFVFFFVINICTIETINHFTPLFYLFFNVLFNIVEWIIDICIKPRPFEAPTLIGFLIITFGFLVYNETIILHFWKLDYNIGKMLKIRNAKSEQQIESISLNQDLVDETQ